MKCIWFAMFELFYWIGAASAACTVPVTLANNTLADADQVMQNFNAIAACVDATNWVGVTNNAALKLTSTVDHPGIVYRAGFTSSGDGGDMTYRASGSACSLNAGNGDNGSQVKSSDGKCWLAQFPTSPVDARVFGAKGDGTTDDTIPQAALLNLGLVAELGGRSYNVPVELTCSTISAGFNGKLCGVSTLTGAQPELSVYGMVLNDSAAITTGSTFGVNLASKHKYGGSTAKGGRVALQGELTLTAPTSAANANRNYVGVQGSAIANTADNGIVGTPRGALFAYSGYAVAKSGATNLLELAGAEINVDAKAGSSMQGKFGWTIVSLATDAVHGTIEAMLGLSNNAGAVGWNNGILFSPFNGVFPIAAAGTLIATIPTGGGSSILNGLDLSGVTVTGCAVNLLIGAGAQCAIYGSGNVKTSGNMALITGNTDYWFYGPGFTNPGLNVVTGPTAVNYLSIGSSVTGSPIGLTASGTDTDIDIRIIPKGVGLMLFGNLSSWAANGSVATVMTSLGPVDSNTTVQEWIKIKNATGVTRYIPAY